MLSVLARKPQNRCCRRVPPDNHIATSNTNTGGRAMPTPSQHIASGPSIALCCHVYELGFY